MPLIRLVLLSVLLALSGTALAQVQSAKGKATVSYVGPAASVEAKTKAMRDAQAKAIEYYYAEAGSSESSNFDVIRDRVFANPDRFILDTTIIGEEDRPDLRQYTVAVRVSLNVANLRNEVKRSSAVATATREQKSALAFLFVSRQVESIKDYDARVYKRVDTTFKGDKSAANAETGVEGESIKKGQIATNASTTSKSSVAVNKSASVETGGSTTRKAADSTWRLMPSANLGVVFKTSFTTAGFKVYEARDVEPVSGGNLMVATIENDYKSGNDLQSATLASVVAGMRAAQITYVALGTLDVGLADKDPATGLMRVAVVVNAEVKDVSQRIPESVAVVGPVTYSGLGPTEAEAQTVALKAAATNAARELLSQMTDKGIK